VSSDAVKQVFARAAEEPRFRARLVSDPGAALAHDATLTAEEKESLKILPQNVLSGW
jgi:hypothetical protein